MVGSRIGKYRLLKQLGEGGMGVVYEAVREDIAARAAIKVLRPEYAANPELAGRFFNEARAANLIAHPGIVRVFDYGAEEGGIAYLAMEYLEGESLWKRIERQKKLPVPEALRIARQIASALAAAHEKQIVHREDYVISIVCFHVGHLGPQRRRNKPCPLTVPAAARSALTSH